MRVELAEPGATGSVVVVGVWPGEPDAGPRIRERDAALVAGLGVDLGRRLARGRATGARGELTWIDLEGDEPVAVLALGMGSAGPADARRAAALAGRRLRGQGQVLVRATAELDPAALQAFVEGLHLAVPAPTWARTSPSAPAEVIRLERDPDRAPAHAAADDAAAVARGVAHGRATLLARRLAHTPPQLKGPDWLAQQAVRIAGEVGLRARTWQPEQLAADGFGGIVAVGAGSDRPPRLVQLDWGDPGQRRVVLVGKGITFDSGGLSLKPADSQPLMKTDMSGAAAVLATMAALPAVGVTGLHVTGLLAIAENLPGAAATRPGDVVVHHGGGTSEVVNTDAEGRLVLADALDYAVRDLGADVVIDLATLTGAATLALGRRHAALYATAPALGRALETAGAAAGELTWPMPLHAAYADLLRSEVADMANAELSGPGPGSITAALFLRRFVADTPWAHLDIAGPARSEADRDDLPKGGTGFGARLLLRWLEAGAPA